MDRTKTPPESTSSIPFRVTDRRPNYENPSGKEPQDSIPEPRHPSLVGTPYEPHLAEAVEVTGAATPSEDNTIVEEVRRGYQMGGQVLRPAQVRVARIATDAVTSDPGSKPSPLPES